MKQTICFGEVLFDQFRDKSIPGGAPMNVALHFQQLGFQSLMISMVGKDRQGEELLSFLKERNLNTSLIGIHESLPTGLVLVNDQDPKNVTYEIVEPAAYDEITWSEEAQEAIDQSEVFVYGSLATRNEVSRKSLLKYLSHTSTLKVFDINLRPPFDDLELLEDILVHTDILKVNEHELQILADYHEFGNDPEITCEKLEEAYDLRLICVTRGDKGAMISQKGEIFEHEGYQTEVVDTVGSGDAFLAALIYGYLEGEKLEDMLDFACALGTYVASHKGATPKYDIQTVRQIMG
ncbi:carbohydrate kinase [Litoribacter alkaliphilus]|uniref:Carbohydrate kinase n=1 Tax=Litoribacter ruber TaxID=702568 RepID=A0AAP2CFR3_9BACT|nr:carbohydrate kinase [Litoribacter alkaliphilus]MBS9522925.1 carbohydrate kinase [Litoribacter alkaliphilus]